MQQLITGLLLVVLNTAQYVSGIHIPIIRSLPTAAAATGLPLVIRDNVL
jgi:hypothetical protein